MAERPGSGRVSLGNRISRKERRSLVSSPHLLRGPEAAVAGGPRRAGRAGRYLAGPSFLPGEGLRGRGAGQAG